MPPKSVTWFFTTLAGFVIYYGMGILYFYMITHLLASQTPVGIDVYKRQMFTDFLAYKMERAGKKLIRIDRWYPSSKTCSCCGKVKEDLQLSDRIYECVCGNRMDRDENAAINICREGIRISGMMPDIEKKIS